MKTISVNLSAQDLSKDYIGKNLEVSYTVTNHEPWIRYGCNNDLPYFLCQLKEESPTHKSLLRLKSTLTAGDGFLYDKNNIPLKNFIEDNNLHQVYEDAAKERVMFNASALEVIYNFNNKIASVKNLTIPALRIQNAVEKQVYYISLDWRKHRMNGYEPFTVPIFNPTLSTTQKVQVLYDYTSEPNNFYYGMEDYRSGLRNIQIEKQLTTHWLASTQNGMVPSGVFAINEDASDEDKIQFKRDLKEQFQGVDNAGNVMVIFYEKDKAPEFIPINTKNNADIYDSISNLNSQKIISCHSLSSPSLAGLPSGGIFTNEMSTAFEYFSKTIIKDYQKPLLNQFRKIFKYNGLIKDYDEVSIKQLNPIQFQFSENVLLATLTKNELRKHMGYDSIEDGDTVGNAPVQTQVPHPAESRIAPAINPSNVDMQEQESKIKKWVKKYITSNSASNSTN